MSAWGRSLTESLSEPRTTIRCRLRRTADSHTDWNSKQTSPGPNPWTTVQTTTAFCLCMRAAGCSPTTCRVSIAPSSRTWRGCTKFQLRAWRIRYSKQRPGELECIGDHYLRQRRAPGHGLSPPSVDLIGGGDGQRINVSANPNSHAARETETAGLTRVCSRSRRWATSEAPPHVYRGPGQNQWDLSVFKNVVMRERASLQFRGEFYNAFNHTQWSGINSRPVQPGRTQTNALFGQATSDRGPASYSLP